MPGIKWGSADPSALYLGANSVSKIYMGQTQVWPATVAENTGTGPNSCYVPIFLQPHNELTPIDPILAGHPESCRSDLGTYGNFTQNSASDESDTYAGFYNHSGTAFVDRDVLQYTGGVDSPAYHTVLRITHAAGSTVPTGLHITIRVGSVRDAFIDALIDNGYLIFRSGNGNLGVLKASNSFHVTAPHATTNPAHYTLEANQAHLAANHANLNINIVSNSRRISSDFSNMLTPHPTHPDAIANTPDHIYSVGYFSGLDAIRDIYYEPDSDIDGAPYSHWVYGAQWTTYGTGESARSLFNAVDGTEIYRDGTNDDTFLAGSLNVAEGLDIGRIRFTNSRYLLLNRLSGSSIGWNSWVGGDGAGKSLFIAISGNVYEVPLDSAAVNYGTGFIRFDTLHSSAPDGLRDVLVNFTTGVGYQMIMVFADSGSVSAPS